MTMLCYALCISQCYTSRHIRCLVCVAVVNTFFMIDFHKMYPFSVITNVRMRSIKVVVTSAAYVFDTYSPTDSMYRTIDIQRH
jgi:hypothetical protein